MDETDQRPPLVVCDAGPLIHLDELACLDLLADFPAVLVPPEVWREVQQHRLSALGQAVVTLRQVSPIRPVPAEFVPRWPGSLPSMQGSSRSARRAGA
ncbi:MAG: hypothetical protein HC808_09995 [Candidatus Competibacteraceae bacterium]|nr:hypothetical protein [Candidatus Competibacteraceae bacterium]